ncbi:MAG TPA: metalloregulator ArsR/SmtB family transcription factor [Methylomirabilota bacterium]|jgi:DNA-binding transcriptional ArsR family regulator|nr:metalloregulator ArsR/SmtB family transcription factor [Methylomirabilota bacterium]
MSPAARDDRLPDGSLKAKLFRGLADSSRLAVLEALRDGPRCVSEVVAATGLSQPNASAHLACLGECGLVNRERRGRFVYYAIADKRVVRILEEAEAILAEVGSHVYRCTRYEVRAPAARRARTRRRPGRSGA